MIYYRDKKTQKKIAYPWSWYNNPPHQKEKKNIDLMSPAQRMDFLSEGFQMTEIALVSVINHYHINGLHVFWDIVCKRNTQSRPEDQLSIN